jgi:mutator protein MutT
MSDLNQMSHEMVTALIIRSGMILLGHRSPGRKFFPNVWDMFGGHIEPGEDQHRALVRELQEELGITPSEWTYEETFVISLPDGEGIFHLYRITSWSGNPANLQPEEHDAIQWFSLDQAVQLNLAHPNYPQLFARYLA